MVLFLLYRKDRRRRSFELKMPAGRRATQIDDLGIKKDKNLPYQILHQDRHHLENNPYPAGLPRSYGECGMRATAYSLPHPKELEDNVCNAQATGRIIVPTDYLV